MELLWHKVKFVHSCGRKGAIMDVFLNRNGNVIFYGVCVICGEEFETEEVLIELVSKCAVDDYINYRMEHPDQMPPDFLPNLPEDKKN